MQEINYEHRFKTILQAEEDVVTVLNRFNPQKIVRKEENGRLIIEAKVNGYAINFELKQRKFDFTKEIKNVSVVNLRISFDKELSSILNKFRRVYEIKILRGGA